MPIITEVQFAHDDGALADTFAALPEAAVRVIRETSTNPREDVSFLRFENASPETAQRVLRADHTVSRATQKPKFDDEHLWAVTFAPETKLLAPRVTDNGGLVVDARSSPTPQVRGWYERWLLPDREAIHDIWEYARDEGFTFDLLEFHEGGQTDASQLGLEALTDEQRETLETAYASGYFAEPRETSLEELGATLDLSASAVGGRLKRGMKALIGETLVVENEDEVETRAND